jgi:YkoY family integral membrane protein
VLSIDNALVLGLLAKRLPPHQRQRALTYGLVGAFAFRVLAICMASLLLRWTFVKLLGGGYLVYIAVRHLFFESQEKVEEEIKLDAQGNPILVDAETGKSLTPAQEELEIEERVPVYMKPETRTATGAASFWPTVMVIELTDVAFAVDSILAAMALAGSRQDKLWVVIAGGILGVVLMRFAAVIFIKLLDKFPRFEMAAYLLVTVIGLKLLFDWGLNSDWSFDRQPAVASRLGTWHATFQGWEKDRLACVDSYEAWLEKNWIFGLPGKKHSDEPHDDPAHEDPSAVPHTPHLLDFHDLRRPECMTFWAIMAICFGIGFIRPKEKE